MHLSVCYAIMWPLTPTCVRACVCEYLHLSLSDIHLCSQPYSAVVILFRLKVLIIARKTVVSMSTSDTTAKSTSDTTAKDGKVALELNSEMTKTTANPASSSSLRWCAHNAPPQIRAHHRHTITLQLIASPTPLYTTPPALHHINIPRHRHHHTAPFTESSHHYTPQHSAYHTHRHTTHKCI